MNLLQVISSVNPDGGGPIEAVRQLGSTLSNAGHQVEVASLDSSDAHFVKQFPLTLYALGPTVSKYGLSMRFVSWMRTHRSQYDAIIVNGIWQFHSYGTWLALRNSNTPYVLFTHGMLDPWFKKQYPLKHLKKWMYWPWAEYRVLRDAHAVLFTCEEERILAQKSFWLYRCNQVVVNLGTSRPQGDPNQHLEAFFAHYPGLRGKRLAMFMGRIHPKKGCDLLIEAFAAVLRQHSEWHLLIAGPDQVRWRERLTCLAAERGVAKRITWTGMVSGAVKWGALRATELLVLPSHQENFGIVVVEALSQGVPVLISNRVNIWREIKEDGAGLVAEDTLEGTCHLLGSYLAMKQEAQLAMRHQARACFERRFEIGRAADTLYAVLAGVTRQLTPNPWNGSHKPPTILQTER